MIVYTVHEPPEPPADRFDRAEALVFVRDGFSLSAMLFAPLWMALNGMWLVLAGYVALVSLLAIPALAFDADTHWPGVALTALHLVVGYEAASLRRWTLERQGYRFLSSVTGRSAADCERRFFEAWLPHQPLLDHDRLAAPAATIGVARTTGPPRAARHWWRWGSRERI
ncbi:MAG TPA: DUF2628 domain-containing protein [Hyphomicrobiaceae bacterium]|nr:DUF2628 domain-containing protein [Hyphomicrobiaceae bacterium]